MAYLIKNLFFFVLLWMIGCGVKSRPLPPTTPPPIGRGASEISLEVEDSKIQKKKNKTTNREN